MTTYLALKYLHVLSGAILFGTGVGIAYFMLTAHCSRNIEAIRVVSRQVILADWIFTATAVVAQPLTGIALMAHAGWSFNSNWFYWVIAMYLATGACWVPVVVLQYRLSRLVNKTANYEALGTDYHQTLRLWMALGVPAFAMMLALYALMIFKPGL